MPRNNVCWIALLALAGWLFTGGSALADDDALGFERTPPRLSYLDGEVVFFRSGAPDWVPAAVNTPLAAGDELYAPMGANLEIQIGSPAFVRAGEGTELALTSLEPDYLQLRVTDGTLSLDLRSVEASQTFEIDTPNAAFTIERSGYYRVEVDDDTTTFITRRGGRASVTTLARSVPGALAASELVVITGIDEPLIETYAAPELDAWDRWNYERTDRQVEAVSARYVPAGVYGTHDLDQHGTWRVVPSYGAVWVPARTVVGWAPYTTGRWLYDPYYGWTWIDSAPWGWAPYHYGRWVRVSGYWAWAPGPIVARPYYAPALVAFYGSGYSVGGPIGWVALGWGEPLAPWWGPVHFRRRAHWAGWGGPRVVNNVVIKHKTVIKVEGVHQHEHRRVRNAFVAVDRADFGRRSVKKARIDSARTADFEPIDGDLAPRPFRESLVPSSDVGRRPPLERRDRAVVATRAPRLPALPEFEVPPRTEDGARRGETAGRPAEPPVAERRVRVVEPPRAPTQSDSLERPPFGNRADVERAAPPPPPRYERPPARDSAVERTDSQATAAERPVTRPTQPQKPRAGIARPPGPEAAPRASQDVRSGDEAGHREPREGRAERAGEASEQKRAAPEFDPELPGVPANRVYRGRAEPARPTAEDPGVDPGARAAPRGGPGRAR
jgi:hypothetical protein